MLPSGRVSFLWGLIVQFPRTTFQFTIRVGGSGIPGVCAWVQLTLGGTPWGAPQQCFPEDCPLPLPKAFQGKPHVAENGSDVFRPPKVLRGLCAASMVLRMPLERDS